MKHRLLCAALIALGASAALAQDFDAAVEAETCAACHGADGVPVVAEAPIIWGQQFYYLYVQLRDYASDLRANEIMGPLASNYDKDQLKALAEYFAAKPWPDVPSESAADLASEAKAAFSAGECSQCHNNFDGDSRIPRLAGQTYDYLSSTFHAFKDRVRMNAPDKAFLLETFSDDEIEAMARYLAAL